MNLFADPMAPNAAAPARSAALLLHALSNSDRQWLLQQLRPEDCTILAPMLEELRQMGIPADRALLRELLGDAAVPGKSALSAVSAAVERPLPLESSGNFEADCIDRLVREDPVALAAVLRPEPAQLIAHLLLMRDWPWRTQVLMRLGPAIRGRVESAVMEMRGAGASVRTASAMRASLLKHVCARVDRLTVNTQLANAAHVRVGGAVQPQSSRWAEWLRKLGRRP